jgi:hypothetical protein
MTTLLHSVCPTDIALRETGGDSDDIFLDAISSAIYKTYLGGLRIVLTLDSMILWLVVSSISHTIS